jgi:hydrogenase large subunit
VAHLVVDPVSRVNGQLRIEVDVTGGAVADAWSSGTMFRGLETVLGGRDPRDAWQLAARICGTCTGVHALGAVRAVEQALGATIPTNARLVRNLIASTELVRDHVFTFYQAQLPDWVDSAAALEADPAATAVLGRSMSDWPTSTAASLKAVQARLAAALADGSSGPFATPWPGHPAYLLSPEQSLLLLAHALEAFDWQREFMRVVALLGGKDPHPQTYLVGGMALAPPWGGPAARQNREHPELPGRNAPNPLSAEGLTLLDGIMNDANAFVTRVYVPDVRLLAGAYAAWTGIGAGPGTYLSWGDLPESDGAKAPLFLPGGILGGGSLARATAADLSHVTESVVHSWYAETGDGSRDPAIAATAPAFDASVPLTTLDPLGRYSWVKAPRYDGAPMETGPLARVLLATADGRDAYTAPLSRMLTALNLGADAMPSVIGRMIARAVEAEAVARRADSWVWELKSNLATGDVAVVDLQRWDPSTWPGTATGTSTGEGPRGSVAHWVGIGNNVVDHYQVVDGSTWNLSPRDGAGTHGPLETALNATPVADPAQPVEILRVVHSFNPCPACAVHAFGARGPIDLRVRAVEASR